MFFTLFAAEPAPCDLVAHLDATDRSVAWSTEDLQDELEAFLDRCEVGALPMDGTFDVFGRLGEHIDAPGTDAEVAERSLTVARVAQRVIDTSLVGTVVMVGLELRSSRRLEAVRPESLVGHRDALRDLVDSPSLDLAYERKAVSEFDTSELSLTEWLYHGWAVDTHTRATLELQGLLERPDAVKALEDWERRHATGGRAFEGMFTFALAKVLGDWVVDRREADVRWRALAQDAEHASR